MEFLPFKIKSPFVIFTGSAVTQRKAHDIDVMITTPFLFVNDIIANRTIGALKRFLVGFKTHFINAYYVTPFSPYVPVYDLLVRPFTLQRKYAPLLPKGGDNPTISVDLYQIYSFLPVRVRLWARFIYYSQPQHTFYLPGALNLIYRVPLIIRLTRMFPSFNQPKVKFGIQPPRDAKLVYRLEMEKRPWNLVEM